MLQSRVGLRSLGKSTAGLYKVQSVPKTRFFSTNTPSDRDQQLEFAHLGTFWKKGTNLLFDAQERARYLKLQKSGILPKDSFWSPVWTYICLENPLLKKYGVTASDLIDGAKHSYVAVNEALSDPAFYKHLRGEVDQCDSHDFLSSVQAPDVYEAWRSSSKQFDDSGMRFSLTSLKVTDVAIRNVVTKIVPGDVPADTEYMTDFERASYLEATEWFDKMVEGKTDQKEDTLEPPVSGSESRSENVIKSESNVVEPLHNTTPAPVPAAPINTPIPSTSNPTTSSTTTPAPPSPTPAASPVAQAAVSQEAPSMPTMDNFSVQPATRHGRKRIAVPARTGKETTTSTSTTASTTTGTTGTAATPTSSTSTTTSTATTPASTTTDAAITPSNTPSNTPSKLIEKYDEVYHIPPITAEGTPVQVEDHSHAHTSTDSTNTPNTADTTTTNTNSSTDSTTHTANTTNTTNTDAITENTTNTPEAEQEVSKKTGYARDYELFPPGSVLAYVDVQIKAHEESRVVLGKDKSPDGKEVAIAQTKDRDVMWSYRACISGQVPLEWVLVDINGRRAEAFRT